MTYEFPEVQFLLKISVYNFSWVSHNFTKSLLKSLLIEANMKCFIRN